MNSNHERCPRRRFLTEILAAGTCVAALTPVGTAAEKGETSMSTRKNDAFDKDGKFLADKARDAYFSMRRRFN